MSKRIEELELRRKEARHQRDEALEQLRMRRELASKSCKDMASAFLDDLRASSAERRSRACSGPAIESYLAWLANMSEVRAGELWVATDGVVQQLALAELQVLITNHRVCALNKELTRLRAEFACRLRASA